MEVLVLASVAVSGFLLLLLISAFLFWKLRWDRIIDTYSDLSDQLQHGQKVFLSSYSCIPSSPTSQHWDTDTGYDGSGYDTPTSTPRPIYDPRRPIVRIGGISPNLPSLPGISLSPVPRGPRRVLTLQKKDDETKDEEEDGLQQESSTTSYEDLADRYSDKKSEESDSSSESSGSDSEDKGDEDATEDEEEEEGSDDESADSDATASTPTSGRHPIYDGLDQHNKYFEDLQTTTSTPSFSQLVDMFSSKSDTDSSMDDGRRQSYSRPAQEGGFDKRAFGQVIVDTSRHMQDKKEMYGKDSYQDDQSLAQRRRVSDIDVTTSTPSFGHLVGMFSGKPVLDEDSKYQPQPYKRERRPTLEPAGKSSTPSFGDLVLDLSDRPVLDKNSEPRKPSRHTSGKSQHVGVKSSTPSFGHLIEDFSDRPILDHDSKPKKPSHQTSVKGEHVSVKSSTPSFGQLIDDFSDRPILDHDSKSREPSRHSSGRRPTIGVKSSTPSFGQLIGNFSDKPILHEDSKIQRPSRQPVNERRSDSNMVTKSSTPSFGHLIGEFSDRPVLDEDSKPVLPRRTRRSSHQGLDQEPVDSKVRIQSSSPSVGQLIAEFSDKPYVSPTKKTSRQDSELKYLDSVVDMPDHLLLDNQVSDADSIHYIELSPSKIRRSSSQSSDQGRRISTSGSHNKSIISGSDVSSNEQLFDESSEEPERHFRRPSGQKDRKPSLKKPSVTFVEEIDFQSSDGPEDDRGNLIEATHRQKLESLAPKSKTKTEKKEKKDNKKNEKKEKREKKKLENKGKKEKDKSEKKEKKEKVKKEKREKERDSKSGKKKKEPIVANSDSMESTESI